MLFKKDWRPMGTKGQLAGVHPETNVAGHWLVRHKDVLTFQRVAMLAKGELISPSAVEKISRMGLSG